MNSTLGRSTGSAARRVARRLVLGVVAATALLVVASGPAAAAPAPLKNCTAAQVFTFVNTIDSQASTTAGNVRSDDPVPAQAAWLQAVDAARTGIVPCNHQQENYLLANISNFQVQAAWEFCYSTYYLPLATGGKVGDWLTCITPVNALLVAGEKAIADAGNALVGTTCDPTYVAPTGWGRSGGPTAETAGRLLLDAQTWYARTTATVTTLLDLRNDLRSLKGVVSLAGTVGRNGTTSAVVRFKDANQNLVDVAQGSVKTTTKGLVAPVKLGLTDTGKTFFGNATRTKTLSLTGEITLTFAPTGKGAPISATLPLAFSLQSAL